MPCGASYTRPIAVSQRISPAMAATFTRAETRITVRNFRTAALGGDNSDIGLHLALDRFQHGEGVALHLVESELDVAHDAFQSRDENVFDRASPPLGLLDLPEQPAEGVLL